MKVRRDYTLICHRKDREKGKTGLGLCQIKSDYDGIWGIKDVEKNDIGHKKEPFELNILLIKLRNGT